MWSNLTVDCGPDARWVFFHWYRQSQLSGPCPPTTGMSFSERHNNSRHRDEKTFLPGFWKHAPRSPSYPHTTLQACVLLRNSSHAGLLLRRLDTIFCHGGNDSVVETCSLGNRSPSAAVSVLSHSFSAKTAKKFPHSSAGEWGLETEGIRAQCSCLDMTDCWKLTSWLSVSLALKTPKRNVLCHGVMLPSPEWLGSFQGRIE